MFLHSFVLDTPCTPLVIPLPLIFLLFFFQAEDGIRDLVRSRGLGDVYKRQEHDGGRQRHHAGVERVHGGRASGAGVGRRAHSDLSLIHI